MLTIRFVRRKGRVLTSSSLRCLASAVTINPATGCAHNCAYCYIKGYPNYPGDHAIVLYQDTAERVAAELRSGRAKPACAYFCPSTDAFQPVEAVLDESCRTMRIRLESGVDVRFATKGVVPNRFLELFGQHRGLVSGQIGLLTLDDDLNHLLEPGAPPARQRLATVRALLRIGADISLRADPIIHGVTDSDRQMNDLFAAARSCGVRSISASHRFLRPPIVRHLKRPLAGTVVLERLLEPFRNADRMRLQGGAGGGLVLPAGLRRRQMERLGRMAAAHHLRLHFCGCKNADLVRSRCHLAPAGARRNPRCGGRTASGSSGRRGVRRSGVRPRGLCRRAGEAEAACPRTRRQLDLHLQKCDAGR
jgi:DNA repair photolyase